MTALSELSRFGGGEKRPSFSFVRVGDGLTGTIVDSRIVDVKDMSGMVSSKLVIEIEIASCKGGKPEKDGNLVVAVHDFAPGEVVAVWLKPGYGIGAVADAIKAAGASQLEAGGKLTIRLAEKRDVGKQSPANVYAATYTAPARGVSLEEF
jgi:hypothetical protein